MTISAQISIYPLRQQRPAPTIDALTSAFADHGLATEVGSMSTAVLGEADTVFAALREVSSGLPRPVTS